MTTTKQHAVGYSATTTLQGQKDEEIATPDAIIENTPFQKKLYFLSEFILMAVPAAAVGVGYAEMYRLFAVMFVLGSAGAIGARVYLIGDVAAREMKWETGPFWYQSANNCLALAASMVVVVAVSAPDSALASLVLSNIIFLFLNGFNHFMTAYKDQKDGKAISRVHYIRLVGAVGVAAVTFYLIFGQWKPF